MCLNSTEDEPELTWEVIRQKQNSEIICEKQAMPTICLKYDEHYDFFLICFQAEWKCFTFIFTFYFGFSNVGPQHHISEYMSTSSKTW